MNLPDFVYRKAFWEAFSLGVSGLLALLAFFGKVDPSWAVPGAVISGWIFSLLHMFGIDPAVRVAQLEEEVRGLRRQLLDQSLAVKSKKSLK